MSQIMNGRTLSDEIKKKVKKDVEVLTQHGIDVGLGLMLTGENPASRQYLNATLAACGKVGIKSYQYTLPESVSINEILNVVRTINHDERINGLLVLLPLQEVEGVDFKRKGDRRIRTPF